MLDSTFAVLKKMRKDLSHLSCTLNIMIQLVFMCEYFYMFIVHLGDNVVHITYLLLSCFSIVYFVYYVVTHNNKNADFRRTKRNVMRGLRYFKYCVQLFSICFSLYGIMAYGASELTRIIAGVVAVGFALQILFEVFRLFADKYIDMFGVAIEMDVGRFKRIINAVKNGVNIPALAVAAIDKPIEAVANFLNRSESHTEEDVEEPTEDKLHQKVRILKEQRKKAKEEKKRKVNEEKKRKVNEEVGELKTHIKNIIKNIKKSSDSKEE